MRTESYGTAATKRPETSSLSKARVHLQLMSTITTRILRTVSFLRLRRAFANAHKAIAAWIVVTATGAAAFGCATSGVPDEPPELEDRPLAGMLQPGEDTVNELNRQLPDDCHVEVGEELDIVVLAADDAANEFDVVSVPVNGCAPARAAMPATEVTEG